MKRLIITADDFGLSPEVNAAVLRAHTEGILTCASLMVATPAAKEAIEMAKDMPTLGVGLHLTLVEGSSILPHKEIPDLVDQEGKFSNNIVWSGVRYFFSLGIKKQIEKECEAQIEKFLATGVPIDHINSHNHLHIHPTIANIIVKLAKKYSIPAVRIPYGLFPFANLLKGKAKRMGLLYNDAIFGLSETGAMVESAWEKIIPQIKEGVTEVYTHPAIATTGILKGTMPNYHHQKELEALMNPKIKEQLSRAGIERTTFSDLA